MSSMRRLARPIALLSLLVPLGAAHAFAPTDEVHVGIEPQRTWLRHQAEQERFSRQSPSFARFRASEGRDWRAVWDERTGTPRFLWGAGIPMPQDQERLAAALAALLERHHDLLGFEPGQLARRSISYHAGSDTWYLDFDVLRDGRIPTYRGGITLRVKGGRLILVGARTAPDAPVTGEWAIDRREAESLAISLGPAPGSVHAERAVEPMLLELDGPDGLELRRTWQVRTRTADPPGAWVTFVDAETGELLSVHNEVRFLNGTLTGLHHERILDGSPLVESPIPLARVSGGGNSDITGADGSFTVPGGPVSTSFGNGEYLTVRRQDGRANGQLQDSGPDLVWTSQDADQTEIDTWVFIHQVREWGQSVDPSVRVTNNLVSNVNLNQVCNAYFDGRSVNFFKAGGGCNNTGQIADVEYHEWGHGFHMYSIRAGVFDGSLSEGASDAVSFFMTGDHYIAPTFFTFGQVGAIRNVEPDKVYPEDFSNNPYAIHDNGLIFGGTMWDLLGLLVTSEGPEQGQESTENIFAGILRGGTDIPGTFYEALVSDDDDGDLANGTPHACQIVEAFGRHGIGSLDGSGVAAAPEHEPPVTRPADVKTDLVFTLVPNECVSGVAREATLFYRLDGREWKDAPTTLSGSDVLGSIPRQDAGTIVEYWVEGVDESGLPFRAPPSGEFAPYSYYVGDVLEVGCDTFDEDDGGYRGRLIGDDGDSDWVWAAPTGVGGDPSAAYTGRKSWGTDPGLSTSDGLYEPGEASRLRSPDLDTYHYTDVFLQYRRWLTVEDAGFDKATIEANGKRVWGNARAEAGDGHHIDREWISHAVDLDGEADRGSVNLEFFLTPDDGLEYGGWNIDDVCLLAPDTVDNRLGVSHFEAFDLGGPVALSWTNPRHEGATRVVVVKRRDRFPEAWDDGEILFDEADPEIGATVQRVDPNGAGGSAFYAVYATNGTDWSSFTEEGINAGNLRTAGVPGGEFLDGVGEGDGSAAACGCAGSPGPTSGVGALLLAGLVGRRRRR